MKRGMIARIAATFRRLAACRQGSTAVEMAIVLPVLTLMIVGTICAGWMIYTTNILFYAVQSAARCGSVDAACAGTPPKVSQAEAIQSYAATQAYGISGATFTATPVTACGWQVTATYTFTFVLPFEASNPKFDLTASACFPNMS
jgi:Flp pilus assembly protein TadG